METTKKIIFILIYAVLTLSCVGKKNELLTKKDNFFIRNYQPYQHMPLAINTNDVKHLKMNLYSYKNKLHIGIDYQVKRYDKISDAIAPEVLGILLLDTISKFPTNTNPNKITVNNVIDTISYKKIFDNVFFDKNNIYVISYVPYLGQAYVLDINLNKLRIINDEYIADNEKVYCIHSKPMEIRTKFPKTFKIINHNGLTLGVDSTYIYSMCEPMRPKYFLQEFESIPVSDRYLIVNKHFPNLIK